MCEFWKGRSGANCCLAIDLKVLIRSIISSSTLKFFAIFIMSPSCRGRLASPVNRLLTSSVCDVKVGLDFSGWSGHVIKVGGSVLELFLVAWSVCFRKE